MGRYDRDQVILAKIETTYGTDAAPSGAANAIQVSNVKSDPLKAKNIPRDLMRPYFGASEELVGDATVSLGYAVELSGSGAAGTPPAWGPLLRACGFAEAVSAGNRVEYTPITNSQESLTKYYHDSGVLKKLLGARGSFSLDMGIGNKPMFNFEFEGLDGLETAVANASPDYTAFKKPQIITDTNTSDILLGCTYSAGALSSGTAYPSRGLSMQSGNKVEFLELLGGNSIDVNDREITGEVTFDLTAAQEVSFMASVRANTLQSLGFVHGTTGGNKVLILLPAVQLITPSKQSVNGRRLIKYGYRAVPVNGNDEVRIVAL